MTRPPGPEVQHSLYRYFAVVGVTLEVATVLAAVVFAVRATGCAGGGWLRSAWSALCLPWGGGCGGEHGQRRVGRWAVDAVPSGWRRWRAQWEFSAGHFVVTFAGFLAL